MEVVARPCGELARDSKGLVRLCDELARDLDELASALEELANALEGLEGFTLWPAKVDLCGLERSLVDVSPPNFTSPTLVISSDSCLAIPVDLLVAIYRARCEFPKPELLDVEETDSGEYDLATEFLVVALEDCPLSSRTLLPAGTEEPRGPVHSVKLCKL